MHKTFMYLSSNDRRWCTITINNNNLFVHKMRFLLTLHQRKYINMKIGIIVAMDKEFAQLEKVFHNDKNIIIKLLK